MTSCDDRPTWWKRNAEIKDRLDLPEYDPPCFRDGTFVHEVVSSLEAEFDREIQFVLTDLSDRDTWTVRADMEQLFSVGRRRRDDGNTVFEIEADEFERAVREELSDGRR